MTDADVTARTSQLLLTLFYRQMPQLVEGGHITSRSALYKIKNGKDERYIKDDAELAQYMVTVASRTPGSCRRGATPIEGSALEALARQYLVADAIIGAWHA